MHIEGRRDVVFILLAGIFITNAVLAEIMGGKLINIGPFLMTSGVFCWPVVFITTDLINEYFGVRGVRRLTFLTMGLIVYMFVVTYASMSVPAAEVSPVSDQAYRAVFGQSLWIIIGSLVAFAASQLLDVIVFWVFRRKTKGKWLWLRATGSTVISQIVDTFIVIGIAFWLPGIIGLDEFLNISATNYLYKLIVAIGLTPLIYLLHFAIDRFLGKAESKSLIDNAARESERLI